MSKPLRLAIAGLGTVGSGTLELLQRDASMLEARCGRRLEVAAVSARNKKKKRGGNLKAIQWVDDPLKLAQDNNIDVVVELIGGANGIARKLCETALKKGKHVVTANKALIAHHGLALAKLAERHQVTLAFEAAVAGGIPIIKALRDGLAANRFSRITGILNGTCNYILTTMWEQKRDFTDVLKEAQKLGYAEADPSFDVDGVDTAHKLAILTSLAFGCPPALDAVHVEGIRTITYRDMEFAHELGYRIKLLGIAARTERGIEQRVHPCMVPEHSPIGTVDGVYNGVVVEGDAIGSMLFEGRGAGAFPTASSVVADIMDIARGVRYNPFTLAVDKLADLPHAPIDRVRCAYYLRLGVIDKPGVLADVTSLFRQEKISLHSFLQHKHAPNEPVQIVLATHTTEEYRMQRALASIAILKSVKQKPHMIRIEE